MDSLTIFWAPPTALAQFSCPIFSSIHSVSSRLWLAPLHCCCHSWWSSRDSCISKLLGSSAVTGLHFQQHPLTSFLRCAKLQMFCVTPSGLQNQHHLGGFYTTKFGCQQETLHWPLLEHIFCELTLRNTSLRFHLSDAGLFLFSAGSSAPAEQHRVSQQSKGFVRGSSVSLITADCQHQLTRTTES